MSCKSQGESQVPAWIIIRDLLQHLRSYPNQVIRAGLTLQVDYSHCRAGHSAPSLRKRMPFNSLPTAHRKQAPAVVSFADFGFKPSPTPTLSLPAPGVCCSTDPRLHCSWISPISCFSTQRSFRSFCRPSNCFFASPQTNWAELIRRTRLLLAILCY